MSTNEIRERDTSGSEAGGKLTEERLDAAIRGALRSGLGREAPDPATWTRIQRGVARRRGLSGQCSCDAARCLCARAEEV
jgi:hypothetical protein